MKLRKLLSLLLAAVLCLTISLSLFACEDDPTDEETTTTAGDTVEGEGGDVEEGGGEGEEAAE